MLDKFFQLLGRPLQNKLTTLLLYTSNISDYFNQINSLVQYSKPCMMLK